MQKESWGGRARKGQAEHFESSHYVSGISRLPLSALNRQHFHFTIEERGNQGMRLLVQSHK